MSHFFVGALIPKGIEDVEGEIKTLMAPYDEALEVPEYKAKKKCAECRGKGKRMTTYNPDSKWDWYRIGGRYDGTIAGKVIESDDKGFNFDPIHEELDNNTALFKNVKPKDYPYALILPTGEWVERGQMGWFGLSTGDLSLEDWQKTVDLLKNKWGDFQIIGLDAHI